MRSELLRIRVSFEERYGINLYELFSARPEITLPSADNEVFINLAYYNLMPVELDFFTLSLPAKSIIEKLEDIY